MRANLFLTALLRDQRGATAVEYGLITALIVIAIIGALQTFSNRMIGMWGYVATTVQTTVSNS